MSAAEALRAAQAAGVSVEIESGDLVLKAAAPPPAAVLEALACHKAGVTALLNILAVFPDAVLDPAPVRVLRPNPFPLIRRLLRAEWGAEWATAQPGALPTNVAALHPTSRADCDSADWRALYDERAGILEFEGGMARAQAEAQAFVEVCVEWVSAHPDVDSLPSAQAEPIAVAALARLGIADPCPLEPLARAA